eukprot:TRINITY_DN6064_c0_g2_i1.p1 TRINITY_DN6064_c0_g2~~TRINITY_DN6064_c0_g2_i1.p1  ORF type:complete len:437 (+),score=55.33 TRINITY_DN6064_c0_g2_i1:167-1477(+)
MNRTQRTCKNIIIIGWSRNHQNFRPLLFHRKHTVRCAEKHSWCDSLCASLLLRSVLTLPPLSSFLSTSLFAGIEEIVAFTTHHTGNMLGYLLLHTLAALPAAWEDGYATYYQGAPTGGGACEYPGEVTKSFPFGMYTAADAPLMQGKKACGACFEIMCVGPFTQAGANDCECATKSVVVQIDDACCDRQYNTPHFDLNPAAMDAILAIDKVRCGVAAIRFRQVDCDYNAEGTNIKLVPKPGTTVWWYAFFVWDVAGTGMIEKVRMKSSGSDTWMDCPQSEAFYKCNGSPPFVEPYTVELTDTFGEVLVATDVIKDSSDNKAWDFGTNFGRAGQPVTPAGTDAPPTMAPVGQTPTPIGSTASPTSPSSPTSAPGGQGAPASSGGGVPAGVWVAIVLALLACCTLIVAVLLYIKRKQPAKGRVNMNEFLQTETREMEG